MKKIILLFAISLTFLNCSSSDENVSNNSLIGTWKQTKLLINGNESQYECIEKNYIKFSENNSLEWARHLNPDCNLDEGTPYIGAWNKINETNYSFKTDENFVLKLINNTIEIQEENDDSRKWIFKK